VGIRTPLRCLTIINRDAALLEEMKRLEDYVKSELNVLEVRYESDEGAFIELVAKPNFPVLGKRLGKRMKAFQGLIGALTGEQIASLQADGEIELDGETFNTDEIQVLQQAKPGTNTVSNRFISVDLDCELDDELIRGGYGREIVNRIQQHRKEQGLNVSDRIEVVFAGDAELVRAAAEHRDTIMQATLAVSFEQQDVSETGAVEAEIDGRPFLFRISKTA
jgi:isoleucyl-tRNA synthetase